MVSLGGLAKATPEVHNKPYETKEELHTKRRERGECHSRFLNLGAVHKTQAGVYSVNRRASDKSC